GYSCPVSPVSPLVSLLLLVAAPGGTDGPQPLAASTDRLGEAQPQPPSGALETGLSGPVYSLYAGAISAMRGGHNAEALLLLREARTLCYREYESGAAPR